MPTVTLTFNLPEEQEEFDLAIHGSDAATALEQVRSEIFRPARKHGYSEERIRKFIDRINMQFPEGGVAEEFIGLLEDRFTEIMQYHDLNH